MTKNAQSTILQNKIFYVYIFIFIIPIAIGLIWGNEYISHFSSIILLLLISIVWKFLPRMKEWTSKTTPVLPKAKNIQQRIKENNTPYPNEFNNGLNKWSEYNTQVVIFSIIIFIFQNFDTQKRILVLTDINVFWLFITICLYSTIFLRIKITALSNLSLNDKKSQQVETVKFHNNIIFIISLILCLIITFFSAEFCTYYLSIASYVMALVAYCHQFRIELYHAAIPVLNERKK